MGLRDTDKLAYRESFGAGPIQDFLRRAARELQLWIVGGTLPLVADDDAHVLNSSLVFSPDRKSTRLNSSHLVISYAVFCLKKKKTNEKDVWPMRDYPTPLA